MSDNAKAAFERGKAHYDAEEVEEAVNEFSKAVRLDSQNATYHAGSHVLSTARRTTPKRWRKQIAPLS